MGIVMTEIQTEQIIKELQQDPEVLNRVYALYLLETHRGCLKDKKLEKLSDDEMISIFAKKKGFEL
ncbi:MAG: hypothetical protein KKI07_04290 [Euryarchaeota archaeon]|nr:hypothetical protein [Euryarchaeota archaeon]